MIRKVLLTTAVSIVGLTLACSKSTTPPTSPSSAPQPETSAYPDGSTLKASTPSIVSPSGGTQVTDPLVLTATKAVGKFVDITPSYQFQIRSDGTVIFDSGVVGGGGAGSNVTFTVPSSAGLNPDTDYTWRLRATYQGGIGSWSADGSFKSAVGAYLRGGELRDPLTIGRTVGTPIGNVTFSSEGATINDQSSTIRYAMDQTVSAGEFSFLAKNIKNAAPGGKSKMMAIQQGFNEITDNAYRFTVEKRGSGYSTPGQTRYRIITDRSVWDSGSNVPSYDPNKWYFWQATWGNGQSRVIVRQDSESGPIVANVIANTGSKPYAPNPMVAYVGAPIGRAGPDDASVPRITVKNVWLSGRPRPGFPQ